MILIYILLLSVWLIQICIDYFETNILNTYNGQVIHNRLKTSDKSEFNFKYGVNYDYFNLNKVPYIYSRKDFIGDLTMDLETYLKMYIKKRELHNYVEIKNIFSMCNLKSYGICFNPIIIYFCYSAYNELIYILLEISNTPWNDKTLYLLKIENNKIHKDYIYHKKKMHVSPFNPSNNQHYGFKLIYTNLNYYFKINLYNLDKKLIMYTKLNIKKHKYNGIRLPNAYITIARIYWQALKLYIRNQPIYKINRTLETPSKS